MLKSFRELAAQPDAPLRAIAVNARDAIQWLGQAQTKLRDARHPAISNGTRMDASWDDEAMAWVVPFLDDVAAWFEKNHRGLLQRGLAR
ncbi:hypothetical protein [Mitsuaria sp. GD03876]|uniref:hypothetical protein n=1 Tax=Mitsuaria sp. GD03876 TaxID=2975399 RepID=UPI0024485E6E|nr:hypothetical protein [Mitsuaria sp. GD03876]MDH0864444.1 hypothetical protein [Mitsuaria sp. GD03876]